MGGKQKQANRTKGNVRPSSSSRAAEQLTASGIATSGFIGFGALSGDLGYVPTTHGSEDVDSSVDSDFRMVLRKLSKRDPTTKLKALQELMVMFKENEENSVKTVLPYWPRVYNKLSMDNDRRVRECLQETFNVLVGRIGRSLAPHLRPLMGSWLAAQSDSYAPAASAARLAFQTAFPPAKQAEAINFCKEDVVAHIHDNLLNQTPASLSDPKTTDPEDMESKYQKMVASTLLSVRSLLAALRPEQLADIDEQLLTLLKDSRFWKHAKSNNPMIKGAFYSMLAGLCQSRASLAQQVADKVCTTVLHHLDEAEPTVCGSLWEAILSTVTAVTDCWDRVNARKAVWPKLWTLLKTAGSGSASTIYPNLLPLLSKIPLSVMGQPVGFYSEFFNNMKVGLALQKTQASYSEISAVVTAMIECLRYCLIRHLADSPESRHILDFLMNEQLLPLLEASIVDESPALATSPLYTGTVDLLTSLHFQSHPEKDADTNTETRLEPRVEEAGRLVDNLWKSLSSSLHDHVGRDGPRTDDRLDRVATLLASFKVPVRLERKKSRVRFSEGGNGREAAATGARAPGGAQPVGDKAKPSVLKRTPSGTNMTTKESRVRSGTFTQADSPLMTVVYSTCELAHNRYHTDRTSVTYLRYLSRMVSTFLTDALLHRLYECNQGPGHALQDSQPKVEFFKAVVLPWLERCGPDAESETERDSLVDLACVLVRCAPAPESLELLEHIMQLDVRLISLICRRVLIMSTADRSDDAGGGGRWSAAVTRWFRGSVFGERIVTVSRELCEESLQGGDMTGNEGLRAARWDLLALALGSMDNLESVMGEDYVDQMLTEMRQSLPCATKQTAMTPEQVNHCVSFVCDVATNFYSNIKGCLLVASAEALLSSLFTLSCQENPMISNDIHEKVSAAWQRGVRALLCQRGGYLSDNSFFNQVAAQVRAQVVAEGMTFKKIERLGQLSVTLCQMLDEHLMTLDSEDISSCTDTMRQFRKMLYVPTVHGKTTKWWASHFVLDDLTFVTLPSGVEPVKVQVLPPCVTAGLFSAHLFNGTGFYVTREDTDRGVQEEDINRKDEEREMKADFDLLHDVVYATAFCQSALGKRKQVLSETELGMATTYLEETLRKHLEQLPVGFERYLVEPLMKKSLTDGNLWAVSLGVVFQYSPKFQWSINLSNILQPMEHLNHLTESYVQTLEVSLQYIPNVDLRRLVDVVAAQIVTCPQHKLVCIDGALGALSLMVPMLDALREPFGGIDDEQPTRPAEAIISVMEEVHLWRQQQEQLFAFEKPLQGLTWPEISFNKVIIRLMRDLVAIAPTAMTASHWDFVLCSMVAWVQALHEARSCLLTDIRVQAFGTALSALVTAVATCMRHLLPAQPDAFPPELATEWNEFFSQATFSDLLPIFAEVTEKVDLSHPSVEHQILVSGLCAAVSLCPVEHVRTHRLPARLVAGLQDEGSSALPDELETLLNTLCPLLGSAERGVQIAAYHLLFAVVGDFAAYDLKALEKESGDREGDGSTADRREEVCRSPPMTLVSVLSASGSLLELLVQGLRAGERVITKSGTPEHTAALAYLLAWKLVLAFFKAAPSELRAQYSSCLRDMGAVDSLLKNLFHLMPENPVVALKNSLTSSSSSQRLTNTTNMFAESPRLDLSGAEHRVIGDTVRVDVSTVCRIIHKVAHLIALQAKHFIQMPKLREIPEVKADFLRIARMPNVVGLIDCTHIDLDYPILTDTTANFYNRHGNRSINVQMVCDSHFVVRECTARWAGSVHDARIFRNSDLNRVYLDALPRPSYLLGDSGYACTDRLLTPYRKPKTPKQEEFNRRLKSTRVLVENTFGVIKSRFRLLHYGCRTSPERTCTLVVAAVVLHNIARRIGEPDPDPNEVIIPDMRRRAIAFHQDGAARNDRRNILRDRVAESL